MTKMTPKRLLMLGFSLATAVVSVPALAGGAARPGVNPFEAGAGVSIESWSKSNGLSPLNVIVSSNIAGKLGPCGCSVNPKGGMDRRFNFIESKKTAGGSLLVLDAGNALFASRQLDPSLVGKQQSVAKKIAVAHKGIGLDVQNVGILDLAAGADFVVGLAKESGLRFLSTNLVRDNGTAPFEVAFVKEVPGIGKVLVVGVSALPAEGFQGMRSTDPVVAVQQQIKKHQPKATIVLSDLGQSDDLGLMAKVDSPLVVVGARDLNAIDIPLHGAEGVLVQPGIQGQQLGMFSFAPKGSFSAWRNLTQDKALSVRWNQLAAEADFVRKQESSDDKKRSAERIKESFEELAKYAKGDLSNSWPYAYELYDMDERYVQKNKFTKLALEDQ